jgi:signal transduction histidine kinase
MATMTGATQAPALGWSAPAARGRLPVAVFTAVGLGLIVTQWLEHGNRPYTLNFLSAEDAAFVTTVFALAALGLFLLLLRPQVSTGWLLLGSVALFTVAVLCHAVAIRLVLVDHRDAWVGHAAAWPATFLIPLAVGLLVFAPATWPTGQIERGWRRDLAVVAGVALGALVVSQAFAPDDLDGVAPPDHIANPLGIPGVDSIANTIAGTAAILLVVYLAVATVDLVRRSVSTRGTVAYLLAVAAGFIVLVATGAQAHQHIGDGAWLLLLMVAAGFGLAAVGVHLVRTGRRTRELEASRQRIVAEREDERRRLRAELHDGLGPVLAALRLELDSPGGPTIERANTLLDDAIGEVRRISRDLRPAALDDLGLAGALAQVAANLSQPPGPQIDLTTTPPALPQLPAPVEVAAYRIVSEALTNVIRHASATHVSVGLQLAADPSPRDPVLIIDVVDDGQGLAPGSASGLGLRSIHDRADELGGVATVSATSAGTHVHAAIPITP